MFISFFFFLFFSFRSASKETYPNRQGKGLSFSVYRESFQLQEEGSHLPPPLKALFGSPSLILVALPYLSL